MHLEKHFNLEFALGMLPVAEKPADIFAADDIANTLSQDKKVPEFFDDSGVSNANSGLNSHLSETSRSWVDDLIKEIQEGAQRPSGRTGTAVLDRPQETSNRSSGFNCRTVLLNCNCHSFDEVETQLIKAIRCTLSRAREIAHIVHTQGSAVVYTGHRERCEAVAMVLEDIGLRVEVCA